MKKLTSALCLALCMLVCLTARADGRAFSVQLTVFPDCWPEEQRPLAEGLESLLESASLTGEYAACGDSFLVEAMLHIQDQTLPMSVKGIPSHWVVTTPLLGDVPLMLNNLALLEFGLKAEDYLGVPLQKAALAMPYAHTSAWAVMAVPLAPLTPEADGVTPLPAQDALAAVEALVDLADRDRTVRCYVEALGLDMSLLLEDFSAVCTETLTIRQEGADLAWMAGEQTLLALSQADDAFLLEVSLPHLSLSLQARRDASGFALAFDASGDMLFSPFALHLTGESAPGGLTCSLLNAQQQEMARASIQLGGASVFTLPAYTPEDLTGVNVLSLNSVTLAELMQQAGPSLLSGGIRLIAACPAESVQALMDALEASGVIEVLAEALLYGGSAMDY